MNRRRDLETKSRNLRRMEKIVDAAEKAALKIWIEEARRVMRKHPRLSHVVAAMGTAFWVDGRTDDIIDEGDLPNAAYAFLFDMDDLYYSTFKSPGIKVYPDRIVTNW